MGLLEIGLGTTRARWPRAPVYEEDLTYLGCWSLPDFVEAASRTGDTDLAQLALDRLSERAVASGQTGRSCCSLVRALLARDRDIEVNFQQAIDRLQAAHIPTDLARGRLLFGEWLTTEHRGHDGRPQLRKAREIFESIGAEIFAQRARLELAANGARETSRQLPDTPDKIGPQDGQSRNWRPRGSPTEK